MMLQSLRFGRRTGVVKPTFAVLSLPEEGELGYKYLKCIFLGASSCLSRLWLSSLIDLLLILTFQE